MRVAVFILTLLIVSLAIMASHCESFPECGHGGPCAPPEQSNGCVNVPRQVGGDETHCEGTGGGTGGGGGGGASPYQPYYNLPPEGQRPPMLAVYSYCDVDGTPFCTFFTFEIVGYVDTYGTFNNYSNQDFSSHRTYSTFAVVHGANAFTPWSWALAHSMKLYEWDTKRAETNYTWCAYASCLWPHSWPEWAARYSDDAWIVGDGPADFRFAPFNAKYCITATGFPASGVLGIENWNTCWHHRPVS